jgi:hypothetical protein
MKKFTAELEKLTTPDIRSTLRWLNNNVEKTTKPTELASMKHDKCLKIIEDKYKATDIEKALDALASGGTKKPKTEKAKKADTELPESDIAAEFSRGAIIAKLKLIRDLSFSIEEMMEQQEIATEQSVADLL